MTITTTIRRIALATALICTAAAATAFETEELAPGIWAIEGPAEQRNPENLGNNATFGLIATSEGAILIDAGGSRAGAEALGDVVASLTEQPVRIVINTGGQDHRWLGNAHWQAQGAEVIASAAARADQERRVSMQLTMLTALVGAEGMDGTDPAFADLTFDTQHELTLGGVAVQIIHVAPAHTPGDSFVWLPEHDIAFSGDIVFTGRLLGLLDVSDSAGWIESFDAIAALSPTRIVPGHGPAVTLAEAEADTRAYLAHMRDAMRAHIDAGGEIMGAPGIDQSAFSHLSQFDSLAGRNAQMLFEQMEWE